MNWNNRSRKRAQELGISPTPSKSNFKQPSKDDSTLNRAPSSDLKAEPVKQLKYKNLFEAAQANDVEEAKALRKKGLGINGVDVNGWSCKYLNDRSLLIS
jgi:hypothetical protein